MERDPILHDFSPLFRQYKSGRVERLAGTAIAAPAPVDPATGVATKRVVIDPITPVSACLYLPPNLQASSGAVPLLLYFHGGAFCIQSAFSPIYHPHLTALAARANLLVVSVDYRLAPEHPLPAAYDDCWAAINWAFSRADPWLADHGDLCRVFLAGDSAGANIAHRMALRAGAEGTGPFEGMALVHPYFWGSEAIVGEGLWRTLCGGRKGLDEKWIDPAKEEEKAVMRMACRRVMVCVAERDMMRARGWAYSEMLKRSRWGGEVEIMEAKGERHLFHLVGQPVVDSKNIDELIGALVRFFNGPQKNAAEQLLLPIMPHFGKFFVQDSGPWAWSGHKYSWLWAPPENTLLQKKFCQLPSTVT
ncbi:putative carboxylesterase 2 [Platanthera zijinensis]|uniref:Carboxylesterase 2 n=1 Tax=Platanthera zijinensis TaxID=2320716 RepID=A0AAP0B6B7_9ASPA